MRLTQYLVSPLSQVLQTTVMAPPRTTFYGPERLLKLDGLVRTWYGGDALGSMRQTLDDAGAPLSALHYDPWAVPEGTAPEGFGFTGEWQDAAAGLVRLRARWYQPGQGRFTAQSVRRVRPAALQFAFVPVYVLGNCSTTLYTVGRRYIWTQSPSRSTKL